MERPPCSTSSLWVGAFSKHTNGPNVFKTHWNDKLSCTHSMGWWPKDWQRLWTWKAVVIWTCTVDRRGLFFFFFPPTSLNFLCNHLSHMKRMKWTKMLSFCCPPSPLIVFFSPKQTEPAVICLWHVVDWISYAKPTVTVYVIVCMLSHDTEFWYRISSSVNFMGLEPFFFIVRLHEVWPVSALMWLIGAGGCCCHRPACWQLKDWGKTIQYIYIKKKELKVKLWAGGVIPRALNGAVQECKASCIISAVIRGVALHAVTTWYSSFFYWVSESVPVLWLLLHGNLQGLPNQAYSFIFFYVPFCALFSLIHCVSPTLDLFWFEFRFYFSNV